MDAEQPMADRRDKLRLAAGLTALALALPGGALIGNAFAADGGSAAGSGSSSTQQVDPGIAPVQDEQEDRPGEGADPDCPKRDGEGGSGSGGSGDSGSGSGSGAAEGAAGDASL